MRRVGLWGLGILATLALGEGLVRVLNPTPRVQIVRAQRPGVERGMDITVRHGQPTWEQGDTGPRGNLDCVGRTHVAIFGTSISFGVYYEWDQSLAPQLQRRLDAIDPGGFCVHGFAQPAYAGWNKLALARDLVPQLKPDVVIWEVWGNEADRYDEIEGDWYNFHMRQLDAGGVPYVVPLPVALNRWLFLSSRLYHFGVLALAPAARAGEAIWSEFRATYLPELDRLFAAHPAKVILFAPTYLDRSLEMQAANPPQEVQVMRAWGDARGAPMVWLAEAWQGRDPAELRSDYCHFSPAGSAAAAEVLVPLVLAAASPPPPPGDPEPQR